MGIDPSHLSLSGSWPWRIVLEDGVCLLRPKAISRGSAPDSRHADMSLEDNPRGRTGATTTSKKNGAEARLYPREWLETMTLAIRAKGDLQWNVWNIWTHPTDIEYFGTYCRSCIYIYNIIGFHTWGDPQNGWFIRKIRGTPILGTPHVYIDIFTNLQITQGQCSWSCQMTKR